MYLILRKNQRQVINRPAITLMYAEHKRVPVVTIAFDYYPAINRQLKTAANARWSSTMNCQSTRAAKQQKYIPMFRPAVYNG